MLPDKHVKEQNITVIQSVRIRWLCQLSAEELAFISEGRSEQEIKNRERTLVLSHHGEIYVNILCNFVLE